MTISSRSYPNLYKDSVSLMTVSARILAIAGIDGASVVMATATNVENLARAGLGTFEVRPNDLVIAVSGSEEACAQALKRADELLSASEHRARGAIAGADFLRQQIHAALELVQSRLYCLETAAARNRRRPMPRIVAY